MPLFLMLILSWGTVGAKSYVGTFEAKPVGAQSEDRYHQKLLGTQNSSNDSLKNIFYEIYIIFDYIE